MSLQKIRQVEAVVSELALLKTHPKMVIGADDNVDRVISFFGGIIFGYRSCECGYSHDQFVTALESRGWTYTAPHVSYQMRRKGLSEAEIVTELTSIEMEAWSLFLNELTEGLCKPAGGTGQKSDHAR